MDAPPTEELRQSAVEWAPAASRRCLLVLGMHRSGTSAITRVLNILGAALPKEILGAGRGNEAGHWEPTRLLALHDEMLAEAGSRWDDWRALDLSVLPPFRLVHWEAKIERLIAEEFGDAPLFVLKDPRVCRFVALYEQVLKRMGITPRYVLSLRNPLAVAASLGLRDGMTPNFAGLLWLRHVLDAEAATRGQARAILSYERLLSDWRSVDAVFASMPPGSEGANVPRVAAEIDGFLSRALQHHAPSTDELAMRPDVQAWVKEVYAGLRALEREAGDSAALEGLSSIHKAFNAGGEVFGAAFHEVSELEARHRTALGVSEMRESEFRGRLAALGAALAASEAERDEVGQDRARLRETLGAALKDGEAHVARFQAEVAEKSAEINFLTSMIALTSDQHAAKVSDLQKESSDLRQRLFDVEARLADHARREEQMLGSWSWKLTRPLRVAWTLWRQSRVVVTRLWEIRRRVGSWRRVFYQGWTRVRALGVKETVQRLVSRPLHVTHDLIGDRYLALQHDVTRRFSPTEEINDLEGPLISILLPVYKTPLAYIERAIASVRQQTYVRWELHIVDDGSNSPPLTELLKRHEAEEPRIKVEALEANGGISAATNAALSMARGDYIGLLDHDDMLTHDALEHVALAILADPSLDLVYSDECKVDEGGQAGEFMVKPDWSPSLLLNCMYIGHFSVYRKSLVEEVGGFRSRFDFSQDYDLALRVTERNAKVHHIERILYGWRAISQSAAAGGKDYARASNIAALQDAIDRRGYGGEAVALPWANRVRRQADRFTQRVSIVVPSDNYDNIVASVKSIKSSTTYSNYEIIVVTNSQLIEKSKGLSIDSRVKFAAYDAQFNFSAKCNRGAEIASGEFYVFYNDDVRVISQDWITSLLEIATLEKVGIVGAKLLYENGTIQHAGMVTGVRAFVGTAFHCLPDTTPQHMNYAQSVRDVSLVCGACLMVSADVYAQAGGFDACNFPINHSDVDLCFKVGRLGLRCVYTPYAKLLHIGHASISMTDARHDKVSIRRKDKADILLLRHWCEEISKDPFYTSTMRDLLYADSQGPFTVFPPTCEYPVAKGEKHVLLVFHDLSSSGAPRVLFEIAKHLVAEDCFVVSLSPEDGDYRVELQRIGIPVIIDSLCLTGHPFATNFSRNFDFAVVNTIVSWRFVLAAAPELTCHWYINETELVDHYMASNPNCARALNAAHSVWVSGVRGKKFMDPYRNDAKIMEIGLEAFGGSGGAPSRTSEKIIIGVFGSFEPRKGQDLAIEAMKLLPSSIRAKCELKFFGRTLDEKFLETILKRSFGMDCIRFHGPLSLETYRSEVANSDIVLVPSRDDPLPLVSLDAIGAGRVVVCGPAVGLYDYVTDGESGILARSSAPEDLADALRRAVEARDEWPRIGSEASLIFDKVFSEASFKNRILSQLGLRPAGDQNLRRATD